MHIGSGESIEIQGWVSSAVSVPASSTDCFGDAFTMHDDVGLCELK